MSEINYVRCGNEFTFRGRQFNAYTNLENLEETCKFQFLNTDIIVDTFPRSGTTFTQEIVWQIKNRKLVDKTENMNFTMLTFPFIEFNHKCLPAMSTNFLDILNSQKNAEFRLIKTHVPYDFIKENVEKVNPKMIFVLRNPKDCLVSNYHFYLRIPLHEWSGTFNDFFKIFLYGKTYTGNYFDNCIEWWGLKDRSNVLILFYEDMVKNLSTNVKKIGDFLGEYMIKEEIENIAYKCSFSVMEANNNINFTQADGFRHLRKGIIGNWKEYFSEEQNEIMNRKINDTFDKVGLKFDYE